MSEIKCKDFEINCENSDAECFVDHGDHGNENGFLSKCKLVEDNSLCNHCPYNEKFKDFTYDEWNEYKESIKP